MVLFATIALKLLVQPWVAVQSLNIYGPIKTNIKGQHNYQRLGMFYCSWIGLKHKLITKTFSLFLRVCFICLYKRIHHYNYLFLLLTDVPFPKSFMPLCKKILTRLFRVFVHVYIHHFDRIVSIGAVSNIFNCMILMAVCTMFVCRGPYMTIQNSLFFVIKAKNSNTFEIHQSLKKINTYLYTPAIT